MGERENKQNKFPIVRYSRGGLGGDHCNFLARENLELGWSDAGFIVKAKPVGGSGV